MTLKNQVSDSIETMEGKEKNLKQARSSLKTCRSSEKKLMDNIEKKCDAEILKKSKLQAMFRAEKEKDGLDTNIKDPKSVERKSTSNSKSTSSKSAPKKKGGWSTRGKFKSKSYQYTNDYKKNTPTSSSYSKSKTSTRSSNTYKYYYRAKFSYGSGKSPLGYNYKSGYRIKAAGLYKYKGGSGYRSGRWYNVKSPLTKKLPSSVKRINYYSFLCSSFDNQCDPCSYSAAKQADCPTGAFCFKKSGVAQCGSCKKWGPKCAKCTLKDNCTQCVKGYWAMGGHCFKSLW